MERAGVRAEGNAPGIDEGENDEQTRYMVRMTDPTFVPPAATFEVTEGLFLPVAQTISVIGTVRIGDPRHHASA